MSYFPIREVLVGLCFPLEALGENLFSGHFQLLGSACIVGFVVPFSILKELHSNLGFPHPRSFHDSDLPGSHLGHPGSCLQFKIPNLTTPANPFAMEGTIPRFWALIYGQHGAGRYYSMLCALPHIIPQLLCELENILILQVEIYTLLLFLVNCYSLFCYTK